MGDQNSEGEIVERRYHQTEVRQEGRSIAGTASVCYDGSAGSEYELWPGVVERIAPGAFDAHLEQKPDVVALFNHDPNHILGRTPNTLRLTTDSRGLHYSIDPPDTQVARDLQTSIARGDVRGSSFAFVPTEVEWLTDGERDVRIVRSCRLYDVSAVTTPAFGGSSVGLRAEERSALERERDDTRSRLEHEKRLSRLEAVLAEVSR